MCNIRYQKLQMEMLSGPWIMQTDYDLPQRYNTRIVPHTQTSFCWFRSQFCANLQQAETLHPCRWLPCLQILLFRSRSVYWWHWWWFLLPDFMLLSWMDDYYRRLFIGMIMFCKECVLIIAAVLSAVGASSLSSRIPAVRQISPSLFAYAASSFILHCHYLVKWDLWQFFSTKCTNWHVLNSPFWSPSSSMKCS